MARENGDERARVLVVDDHPLVRQAITDLMLAQGDLVVCGEAEDRQAALAAVAAFKPHLVIVDLELKSSSGLDLIKDIRDHHPKTYTLTLSMHDAALYAERAIRAGASGYVSKQESPARLVDAIRRVLRGEIYWDESVARQIASRVIEPSSAPRGSPVNLLSEREIEVFDLIGAGARVAQIAASLHLSASTVETYRSRIKEKMGLKGSKELLQAAIRWNVMKSDHRRIR